MAQNAQSDRMRSLIRGLHCPQTESLDTNWQQMPWWCFTHAQGDLYLRILRMFEGTFALDATHIILFWRFDL